MRSSPSKLIPGQELYVTLLGIFQEEVAPVSYIENLSVNSHTCRRDELSGKFATIDVHFLNPVAKTTNLRERVHLMDGKLPWIIYVEIQCIFFVNLFSKKLS